MLYKCLIMYWIYKHTQTQYVILMRLLLSRSHTHSLTHSHTNIHEWACIDNLLNLNTTTSTACNKYQQQWRLLEDKVMGVGVHTQLHMTPHVTRVFAHDMLWENAWRNPVTFPHEYVTVADAYETVCSLLSYILQSSLLSGLLIYNWLYITICWLLMLHYQHTSNYRYGLNIIKYDWWG